MKQTELSRVVKEGIWRVFDSNPHAVVEAIIIDDVKIPVEALKKQHRLWTEYRARHPKRK